MSQKTIKKAEEIIHSKTAAVNMGVGVTLSLLDNEGYPTTSCLSISKAEGIHQIYFAAGLSSNKGKRAMECNRASICIFDDDYENNAYYNITLVGDVEVVTDPAVKKDMWYEGLEEHFPNGGAEDPDYCVLRFTTKRYNLWLDFENVTGSFDDAPQKPQAPCFEPILIYNDGQCGKAMELYEKAFGAEVKDVTLYSEYNPEGYEVSEEQKNWIMNAQIQIGSQTILVCDDVTNATNVGNNLQMVMEFKTDDAVKAAYSAMLDGATNLTPPHNAGYSSCVAYLTDAYGIPWQLMVWNK
ncbi:MAG: pyridoxamine 5'-phosphate oxidase family protein [Firmicutes bacterium]|nr:pyridoxamine 5'-phosphate oxidase family protein [Bacillota bacterium]